VARALRLLFPGAIYHVWSRGNERRAIFRSDDDRHEFLAWLASSVERYGVICHGYCLLDNHYHGLIETPRPNLSDAMRHLNSCYTSAFNRSHSRVGHLLQGRYKSRLVEQGDYLLELVRYIILNPVRTTPPMAPRPEDWPWSSYRALLGLVERPSWLTTAWVLGQFGGDLETARDQLRAFVDSGIGLAPDPRSAFFASEDFIRAKTADLVQIPEIPRAQWQPLRPSLAELFETAAEPIAVAHRTYGYSFREIAEHLGCHYTTVSRRLRVSDYRSKAA
jgi:putative transposase